MNNNNTSSTGLIFFCFTVIIALSLQSCVSTRDRSIKKRERNEWKIVKTDKSEKPAWIIYTRKLPGTTFLEYKIEGSIHSSPSECLTAFKQDLYHQADESMQKKFPTYNISKESETGLLTYVIHNEPFPLKDTEMRIRYSFHTKEDGSTGVKWQEAWEDSPIQATNKLNRIETFRGSWAFTPMSTDLCQGVNIVQFDPKKMPRWLFEPMVFKFLKEGLSEINKITAASNEEITSLIQH